MADGEIIIDVLLDNDKARRGMKLLQAKAKSTAQQINDLNRRIEAAKGNPKPAQALAKARQEAEATRQELDALNEQLRSFVVRRAETEKKSAPEISGEQATARAQEYVEAHFSAEAKRAVELEAALEKQTEKAAKLDAEYQQQRQELAMMERQHAALGQRLEQEVAAAQKATDAYNDQAAAQKRAAAEQAAAQKRAEAAQAAAQKRAEAEQAAAQKRAEAAQGAVSRFGSRLRGLAASALVFNVISAGLRGVVGAFGTAIGQTDGFRQALANLKGAALTAAAPLVQALGGAITTVINLLAAAMNALAKFIALLTGKSLAGMQASAKAMAGVGSAAAGTAKQVDKAANATAAFDELHVLDQGDGGSSGGGGDSTGISFAEPAVATFDALLGRLHSFWEAFAALLAPSAAAWQSAWEQIQSTALAVWPRLQAAALGLWEGALAPLLGYLGAVFAPGIVNSLSQAFAPIVGGTVSAALLAFADFWAWLCGLLADAVNTLALPALGLLLQVWQGLMAGIQAAWDAYGQPILDGVLQALGLLWELVGTLYSTVLQPVLAHLIELLDALWQEHLQPLWENLLLAIGSLGQALLNIWNLIAMPLLQWVADTFGPGIAAVAGFLADYIGFAFEVAADWINVGLILLRGLLDFLNLSFTGQWEAAWQAIQGTVSTVWQAIQATIRNYINGILGFVNQMIAAICNGLNAVLAAMNTLSFSVPSWVPGIGGQTLGFHLAPVEAPQIPYLAQGAVIPPNREFLAVLGDQGSGTNIEAPLDTIRQAMAETLAASGGSGEIVAALRDILDAVLGIRIGDEEIGCAAARFQAQRGVQIGTGAFANAY